jgi:hypothetical protein
MAEDNLLAMLAAIRAELREIPDDQWEKFKRVLCGTFGGTRPYVPVMKKRSHLEALAELGDEADAQKISKVLGISVSRAYQLKRLRKG